MPYPVVRSGPNPYYQDIANISDNVGKILLARQGLYGAGRVQPGVAEYNAARTAHENAETALVQATLQARQDEGIGNIADVQLGLPPGTSLSIMRGDPTATSDPTIRSNVLGHINALKLGAFSGGNQNINNVVEAQAKAAQFQGLPQAKNTAEVAKNIGAILGKPTVEANAGLLYDPYGTVGAEGYTVTPAVEALAAQRNARAADTAALTQPKIGKIEAQTETERSRQGVFGARQNQIETLTPEDVKLKRAQAGAAAAAGALSGTRASDINATQPSRIANVTSQTEQHKAGANLSNVRAEDIKAQQPSKIALTKAQTEAAKHRANTKILMKDSDKAFTDIARARGYSDTVDANGVAKTAKQNYIEQTDPEQQALDLRAYKKGYEDNGGDPASAMLEVQKTQLSPYQPGRPSVKHVFKADEPAVPAQRRKQIGAPPRPASNAKPASTKGGHRSKRGDAPVTDAGVNKAAVLRDARQTIGGLEARTDLTEEQKKQITVKILDRLQKRFGISPGELQ